MGLGNNLLGTRMVRVITDWLAAPAEQGFCETCELGNIVFLTRSWKDQRTVLVYLLVLL